MCAALVTLCASRFVRDPELQVILNACAAARRFLFRQTEAVVTQFLSIAARYFPRANTSKGPATSFKAYISRLGWTIDLSGHLQVTAFTRIHLLWSPWKTIVMFAERSWQGRLLTLHSHRASLANFPNVDQRLTRQTLDNFSPEDRRLLVREIAGAFQTRVQQAIWDSQVTPECQWCGQPDTKHHRFFSCTATRTVREPFQELVSHLDSFDCLWPELPVLFEDTKDEFRLTFQYNLQEGQPPAELIQNLISCIDEQNPLHVYTDGSCQYPTMPTLRFAGYSVVIDSCRSDSERIWHAHRYKETGIWPTTLHVILQELCPQSQDIHHAELRSLIRAQELFRHAIIHVDSSSAIATFQSSLDTAGHQFHGHAQPTLGRRIQNLPNVAYNRVVKIKGHAELHSLPDLECYHSLGNSLADRAAVEVCTTQLPVLTQDWAQSVQERRGEMQKLSEFYRLSLALQKYRREFKSTVPASIHPDEPHPQHRAGIVAQKFAAWSVPHPWSFSLGDAQQGAFFSCSYWGSSLLQCVLDWLHALWWGLTPDAVHEATVGVSWMELLLSFMFFAQSFVPVRRKGLKGETSFAWARCPTTAKAFCYTWNESATQFAHLVNQTISLCDREVIPSYIHSARVCSLYRMGAGSCVFGWSHRPSFPTQQQVYCIVEETFKKRPRSAAYGWWPEFAFPFGLDDACFSWSTPAHTMNVLQKKLKLGSRLARAARAQL